MEYDDIIELQKHGINEETFNSYQVIFWPENFKEGTEKDPFFYSTDTVDIYKELRICNIRCGDITDLGKDAVYLERRDSAIWLGIIWVLEYLALPILLGIISNRLTAYI